MDYWLSVWLRINTYACLCYLMLSYLISSVIYYKYCDHLIGTLSTFHWLQWTTRLLWPLRDKRTKNLLPFTMRMSMIQINKYMIFCYNLLWWCFFTSSKKFQVANAMAAKAKLLLRELKSVKADLAFAKQRCAQLEEENKLLLETKQKGSKTGEDDDLVIFFLSNLFVFLLNYSNKLHTSWISVKSRILNGW